MDIRYVHTNLHYDYDISIQLFIHLDMRHKHRPVFIVNGISIWHTPAKKNRPTTRTINHTWYPWITSDNANALALFSSKEYKDVYLFKGNFGAVLREENNGLILIKQNKYCSRCQIKEFPFICGIGEFYNCI